MSKIALNIICAGHEKPEMLERVLSSVGKYVDGIFITITTPTKDDKLKKVAEKFKAVVDYKPDEFLEPITKKHIDWLVKFGITPESKVGDKVFRFDNARNHNLVKTPKDFEWILWIDVDDVLRNGSKLKDVIKWAEQNRLDSIFINYIYHADIVDGKIKNIVIEHLRERIIRNAGLHKWVAPIHETLIEQKPTRKGENDWVDVLHLSDSVRTTDALKRNLRNLEFNIYLTEGKDPRPIYYLGKAHFDLWLATKDKKYLKTCEFLFTAYIGGKHQSGWPEERAQCWEYLAEIYRAQDKLKMAIKCGHNAMIEDDRFPGAYLNLSLSYLMKKEWERALHWVRLAARIKTPRSTLINTPRDQEARALEVIYHASIQTGKIDEAWAASQKLAELLPSNKSMKERITFTTDLRLQRELTKSVMNVAQHLEKTGEVHKLKPLLMSLPQNIANNPFMVELTKRVIPPRVWGDNEIAIMCGPCFTTWSPKSLAKPGETFVGGSEEAVIYLSKELTKLGWKVSVYADPGPDEGEHDGVKYLPYYKFNDKDAFNVLIGWRRPDFVDANYKAKKTFIWLHDIANQLDFTPERLSKITKIMVLSPWHRENLPDIPDDKIMITSNGINI